MLSRSPDRARTQFVAFLLFLEAMVIIALITFNLLGTNWEQELAQETLRPEVELQIVTAALFSPAALLTIVAAIGVLVTPKRAWTAAMIAQILLLFVCILLHRDYRLWSSYVLMMIGIGIIFFLNSFTIRSAFRVLPAALEDQQ